MVNSEELNDAQKRFVQTFLRHPVMTTNAMKEQYRLCFGRQSNAENEEFDSVLRSVNLALRQALMMIKTRTCEVTGKEYYVLFNTSGMAAAELNTNFSPAEVKLFKKILKTVVLSEEGMVSSIGALNLSDNIPKLSKKDAQEAIDKFVRAHWLVEEGGVITVGVRSLVELDPVIRKADDSIGDCQLCNSLLIKGVECAKCGVKVHKQCLSQMSRKRDTKCPSCHQTWDSPSRMPVEEDASFTSHGPSKKRRERVTQL